MNSVTTWDVNQYALLVIGIGAFCLIGFRRGASRELMSIIGNGLGMTVSHRLAQVLRPQVNGIYRVARFGLSGGTPSSDASVVWQSAQDVPELVGATGATQTLGLVVFILIALVFVIAGNRRFPTPYSVVLKVLGGLVGCVNGFLVVNYLIPVAFPKPTAVITLASDAMQSTLSSEQTIARVVAFFIFVLIAFGLFSARTKHEHP